MTTYTGAPYGGVKTGGHAKFVPSASGGLRTGGAAQIGANIVQKLPVQNIQALDAGIIVELFVIDTSLYGGTQYYLSANVNEYKTGIVWKNTTGTTVTYTPFPIVADGFERAGKGVQARPTLTVSNASHAISDLVRQYGDLCGCKVVRRRVMARHLDAANFVAGNAYADRSIHYKDEVYYIERRSAETPSVISFELSNAVDVNGIQIPRRMVQRTLCPWIYQGSDEKTGCPFAGPFVDLTSTGGPDNRTCLKTTTACLEKYGANPLPFGGFNGARRM